MSSTAEEWLGFTQRLSESDIASDKLPIKGDIKLLTIVPDGRFHSYRSKR